MKKSLRFIAIVLALVAAILAGLLSVHKYYYPRGFRAGKLPTFMGALTAYAIDHEGKYPHGGATALESLQKLYPQYAESELAGLSGDEKRTVSWLKEGKVIDGSVSSWVYFPGFSTNDDPNIAIIWEREPGLFVNGSRADGHAVGLIGGYEQIPSSDWPAFLKNQEKLRAEARKGQTKN